MITHATEEQWRQVDEVRQWWIDRQIMQSSDEEIRDTVYRMWRAMGETEPLVLIFDSPIASVIVASILCCGEKDDPQLCSHLVSHLVSQLDSQLCSHLVPQLYSQLYSHLDSQLRSQIRSQLYSQLCSHLVSQLRSQLDSQPTYWSIWWNAWAGWYEAGKVLGVSFIEENYSLFRDWNVHIPFVVPYKDIAFVSRRPTEIYWSSGVLHRDGGASVQFADGWGTWSLHGCAVPQWLAETPAGRLDARQVIELENAQQRAEGVRKMGAERLCYELGAKVIDACKYRSRTSIHPYELLAVDAAGERRYLKMLNPSVPELWHVEEVPLEIQTVADAIRWRMPDAMRQKEFSDDGEDWQQQGDVCIWPRRAQKLKPFPSVLT